MYSAINLRTNFQAFREISLLLTRHRQLTLEMARREVSDRYQGQIFGLFWAIGHPLALMVVYLFVFRFVFNVKIGGTPEMPRDYITYLLSGLIPWIAFQESMSKAGTVIINHANLVKQVIFPIEILPVKGVLATLFTQVILTCVLFGHTLLTHHALPATYLLWPILLFIQTLAMIGISHTLAAISVYFRDIKDFVQVFCTIGFYLIPALYLPEFVPGVFRNLLYFNPFSYMVWCYQDALYFGRFAHPWAWLVWVSFSLSMFIIGYRLFRKLSAMFGNFL